MQSLPMNDADAAGVVFPRVSEKCAQQGLGFARVGAVQVQFVLNRDFAATQALQYAWWQGLAPVGQDVAGFGQRRIQGVAEFVPRGSLVAFGHACTRLGLGA